MEGTTSEDHRHQAGFRAWLTRIGHSLVSHHPSITEIGAQRRAMSSASLSLGVLFTNLIGLVAIGQSQGVRYSVFIAMVGLAIAILVAYLLSRSRYYGWGAAVFAGSISLMGYVLALYRQEDIGSILFATVPLSFAIGATLMSLSGLVVLVLGNLVVLFLLTHFSPLINLSDVLLSIGVILPIGVTLTLGAIFRDNIEKERLKEVTESTEELQALSSSLEERVKTATRDLSLATEIGQCLSLVIDPESMLFEAVELIRERFDLYYVQVYMPDQAKRNLILRAGTGEIGQLLLRRGHHFPLSLASINGRAAIERRAVIVEDTQVFPIHNPNPLLPETRSEMALPLIAGDEVLGVLNMQSTQASGLSRENLPAFEALAGQLAIAILNANLIAQVGRAQQDLAQQASRLSYKGWHEYLDAVETPERFGFTYDQEQLLKLNEPLDLTASKNTLTAPIEVLGQKVGVFQLQNENEWSSDDVELVESVSHQLSQQIENLRLLSRSERYRQEAQEAVQRLTRQGWRDMQAQSVPGYLYDGRQVTPIPSDGNASQKQITFDIKVRDEAIGQLGVVGEEMLSEQDQTLIAEINQQLSTQIENIRLLNVTELSRQQLDKRATELETVAKLSTAAATILDPQSLLQSVVELTQSSFNLNFVSIFLVAEDNATLVFSAGPGTIGQQMVEDEITIKLGQKKSLVAKAARLREVVITNDASSDPEFMNHPMLPEALSELALPMIVADKLIGIFDVQADIANRFTEDDKRTFSMLASQTAVALRNAQLYAEQMETVQRLRELDELKSSFLANMSHELRTPLNSIIGFTQVIMEGLDGPVTEDMHTDLQSIHGSGQHLLSLINDVLDMAKIEAGKLDLTIDTIMLPEMLDSVFQVVNPLAAEKSLYLEIESKMDDDLELMADSVRLRQILINLIGNAIKFTNEGGITIGAKTIKNSILISVRDTGIGIPQENLVSIFDAFSQVDTSSTRKVGGTGLGLPISRRLVEMHGGRIWAESSGIPGEGSVFRIELPLKTVQQHIERKVNQ